MTKLQFCLVAYELMGSGIFLYPNNLRFVEEWNLSLNHLMLGEVTEVFKRLFIPQISSSLHIRVLIPTKARWDPIRAWWNFSPLSYSQHKNFSIPAQPQDSWI